MAMFNNLKTHMGQGGNLTEFHPSPMPQEAPANNYNPVYFVEDHGAELGAQGEEIILQPDNKGGFKEVAKYNTFGTGQNLSNFGGMTKE